LLHSSWLYFRIEGVRHHILQPCRSGDAILI
jgi:hypothetical protein